MKDSKLKTAQIIINRLNQISEDINEISRSIYQDINLSSASSMKPIRPYFDSLHNAIINYNIYINRLSRIVGDSALQFELPGLTFIKGKQFDGCIFVKPLTIENGQLVVLDGEENTIQEETENQ